MRSEDADQFRGVMEDLCVAYNRPCTDAVIRVFWDALKWAHIYDVRRMAIKHRDSSKKFPSPRDLAPERVARAPAPKADEAPMSTWAVAANKILFAVSYLDQSRGYRPVKAALPLLLSIKADYVRMAEEAQAGGEMWDTVEFNRMCREGFQGVLRGEEASRPNERGSLGSSAVLRDERSARAEAESSRASASSREVA